MKTAAQSLAAWQAGIQGSGNTWKSGVLGAVNKMQQNAVANVGNWVAGVTAPIAQTKYTSGIQNMNVTQFNASVSGPGLTKFTSSATTKPAKYSNFANAFIPVLQTIVTNLDTTNPRGLAGSPQNRTRLNAYLDALQAKKGTF